MMKKLKQVYYYSTTFKCMLYYYVTYLSVLINSLIDCCAPLFKKAASEVYHITATKFNNIYTPLSLFSDICACSI